MESRTKVTVVGAGQVGIACVVSILSSGRCDDMVLIDVLEDKVKGEVMDLSHGSMFVENATISGGSDYALSANSSVVVISAGARQRPGESRLELVQRNVQIFKSIVPQVAHHSPNATIIVVSNPLDIMTWVTWKLSGFPVERVFGSGTALDSSRFRQMLGHKLGVGASSVHGWIIGEHGDSSVAVWSSVSVAGVPLSHLPQALNVEVTQEELRAIHPRTVGVAQEIIQLKGYTNWGIGLTVASLFKALASNNKGVYPVSTLVKGLYGIQDEVFISVPVLLGATGVKKRIQMELTDEEREAFLRSVQVVWSVMKDVDLTK